MGCQGPGGVARSFYGAGAGCTVQADRHAPVLLADSLAPLTETFDRDAEVPRVVALLPHLTGEKGAEVLRDHVLRPFAGQDLRLYVIWQDVGRARDSEAARRATAALESDPRVTCFHDCSGLAGRAFARGKLPVAEAREVFLFYPAGTRWVGGERLEPAGSDVTSRRARRARVTAGRATPDPDSWVHRLGRVVPERFCSPRELPLAMRERVQRLLDHAASRKAALAQG